MGSMWHKQVNKSNQCVLDDSLVWLGLPLILDQFQIRHYVVATLLGWFWDHFVMDQWIKFDTMC